MIEEKIRGEDRKDWIKISFKKEARRDILSEKKLELIIVIGSIEINRGSELDRYMCDDVTWVQRKCDYYIANTISADMTTFEVSRVEIFSDVSRWLHFVCLRSIISRLFSCYIFNSLMSSQTLKSVHVWYWRELCQSRFHYNKYNFIKKYFISIFIKLRKIASTKVVD